METIQVLIPLILTISLAGLVAAVGLDADRDDLLYLFRRPLQLAKAVLAVNVIVPVAAVLLVFIFPLSHIAKAGVLLMAASPVPPLVPGKELKIGANKSYAYGVYLALILLAVVIVPLSVAVLAALFGSAVSLPLSMVARNVAFTVLLPLAGGLVIRRIAPGLAQRLIPIVKAIATLMLLVAVIPLMIAVWPAMMKLVGNGTIVAMALTAAIGIAGGHFLGGPALQDRGALAMAAATRHPGIALMIANANHADKAVTAAILAMMIVGLLVGVPYQIWLKRRAPAAAAAVHG